MYNGQKGDFIARVQSDFMRFFTDMEKASTNENIKIIDARSSGRFSGGIPEPREGLRSGTIPGSVNLPFTDLMEHGVLKSKLDLEKAFYMKADKDDNIVFSCGSGITACILALGATLAGYKNISVYDGSWTEWGTLVKS